MKPQKFTVIFEYVLPATRRLEVLLWAHRWHRLRALPFVAPDIAGGGGRHQGYVEMLSMRPWELRDRPGRRACAR